MKFPVSARMVALLVGTVVISLAVGGATSYLFLQKSAPLIKFPAIVKHTDLPFRAMESFAASQNVKIGRAHV